MAPCVPLWLRCTVQLMFYSALSLWIALKFWKAFDPEPVEGKPAPAPMTDLQFAKWCVAAAPAHRAGCGWLMLPSPRPCAVVYIVAGPWRWAPCAAWPSR